MNDTLIFVVGLGVYGIVIVSTFLALLSRDNPDEKKS